MARAGAALMAAKESSSAAKERKSGEAGEPPIKIKAANKGGLHRALGIPEGKKIPAAKIAAAVKTGSPNLKRKAQFAQNAASWG